MFDNLLNTPLMIAAVFCALDEKELCGAEGEIGEMRSRSPHVKKTLMYNILKRVFIVTCNLLPSPDVQAQ